ncbi:hypothetical protein AVEN_136623-1 [Araneus ventricosus]|uniref:Uncharacterized protein n=1 Tax=Araneus ventricosus TaxID=182803 RepID=A0A4Y2CB30_ARAVE|nr:hypothetical protein AVEN_136623-1 [Araneus ventricosus]
MEIMHTYTFRIFFNSLGTPHDFFCHPPVCSSFFYTPFSSPIGPSADGIRILQPPFAPLSLQITAKVPILRRTQWPGLFHCLPSMKMSASGREGGLDGNARWVIQVARAGKLLGKEEEEKICKNLEEKVRGGGMVMDQLQSPVSSS